MRATKIGQGVLRIDDPSPDETPEEQVMIIARAIREAANDGGSKRPRMRVRTRMADGEHLVYIEVITPEGIDNARSDALALAAVARVQAASAHRAGERAKYGPIPGSNRRKPA